MHWWILIIILLFAVCCTHVCVCVYSTHCMDTYYILSAHYCLSCTLLFNVLYVLGGDQLRWPAGLLVARLTVGFTVWQINLPTYLPTYRVAKPTVLKQCNEKEPKAQIHPLNHLISSSTLPNNAVPFTLICDPSIHKYVHDSHHKQLNHFKIRFRSQRMRTNLHTFEIEVKYSL